MGGLAACAPVQMWILFQLALLVSANFSHVLFGDLQPASQLQRDRLKSTFHLLQFSDLAYQLSLLLSHC